MSSDVEMVITKENPNSSRPDDPQSPSPTHHSPIPVDDESLPPPPHPRSSSVNGHASSSVSSAGNEPGSVAKGKERKGKPASSAAAKSASGTATGVKPKSTKSTAARSPSPSPPPPPPRTELQTIRLDITLGGPENYEVNIAALSTATGQRPSSPVLVSKPETSDDSHSEGDDEGDGKPKDNDKKRKRKKNVASEYYDITDPFIDDSELAVDERTYFAQTKQQGFYVSSGQVALLTDKPAKKPKSKKVNILAPSASVSAALSAASLPPSLGPLSTAAPASSSSNKPKEDVGTRDTPIALYSDIDDDKSSVSANGLKRKVEEPESMDWTSEAARDAMSTSLSQGSSKKKRKTVEIQPFHPELESALAQLREAIAKENWETKGKFPPSLKPLLAQVALKAVILGEYDDNFFNLMPRLFPYNKFTMTKLIKRTIWRDHTNLLIERQSALLEELAALATEGFPKAREEWEKSVVAWEKRQERAKADTEAGGSRQPGVGHSVEGTPVTSDMQHTPTPTLPSTALPTSHRQSHEDTGNDTGLEHDTGAAASGKSKEKDGAGKDSHPPHKRYRLTDTMKGILWQLVCLSNECCRIENEKNSLEGSNQVVSDQGVRKSLYQKIVAAFPEGWISSGQISREVSVMKKKYEKEAMEIE